MSLVFTYSFQNALPISIAPSFAICCASWTFRRPWRVLEDRFLRDLDVGATRALETERLVERDRPVEIAHVDAVLGQPGFHGGTVTRTECHSKFRSAPAPTRASTDATAADLVIGSDLRDDHHAPAAGRRPIHRSVSRIGPELGREHHADPHHHVGRRPCGSGRRHPGREHIGHRRKTARGQRRDRGHQVLPVLGHPRCARRPQRRNHRRGHQAPARDDVARKRPS